MFRERLSKKRPRALTPSAFCSNPPGRSGARLNIPRHREHTYTPCSLECVGYADKLVLGDIVTDDAAEFAPNTRTHLRPLFASSLNDEAEALVRESMKRTSQNAISANPAELARNFWAVLQAYSARKTSGHQHFPRSAESIPRSAPPKTAQKSGNHGKTSTHFLQKRPEVGGGVPADKVATYTLTRAL